MHGQLVAVLHRAAHRVDVREIQLRVNALRIQVQRDVDQVQVAGALAIAEEAPFHAVRAGHHGQFSRRHASAAVVVRMNRKNHLGPVGKLPHHPFDLVGKDVGRGVFHRGGQVQDDWPPGAPGGDGGFAGLMRHLQLSQRKGLGRVLQDPLGLRLCVGQAAHLADVARDQLHHLRHVQAEHHAPPHGRNRVVDVNNRAAGAGQGLHRALDQLLSRWGHDLNGHVIGNAAFLDQLAHKVEFGLRRGGKADFDLLEAHLHQQVEHAQLACGVHWLDQRLVAVAQVGGQPDRRFRQLRVGPAAAFELHGRKCAVLGLRLLEHVDLSVKSGFDQQPPKTQRPVAGANGPWLGAMAFFTRATVSARRRCLVGSEPCVS